MAGTFSAQSLGIPPGPVNVDIDSKVVLPEQRSVYRSIESMIQQFELVMLNRRWQTPVDEVYGAIESPNGELGFYIVADGSGGHVFAASKSQHDRNVARWRKIESASLRLKP